MPDYSPRHSPADQVTTTASDDILAGQLLQVSGSGTVEPSEAASVSVVGVAATNASTGDKLTYYAGGVQRLTAFGAISAGSPVIAGDDGLAVAHATPPSGQMIGIALTSPTNAELDVRFRQA